MGKNALFSLPILGALAAGWIIWDNFRLTKTRYIIEFDDLPESFDGYTIVQASDLHNARFGKDQRKLIEAVKAEKPDMIAITGDMFHTAHRKNAYSFLEQAAKIAPCYYVSGNHEQRFADYFTAIKPTLESLGARVLDDERVTISKGTEKISVIGLSDPSFDRTIPPEKLTDEKLVRLTPKEKGGFTILLSHRPELYYVYSRYSIALMLTGHAHGGQVRIPFARRALYAVHQGWFPQYTEGIFVDNYTNTSGIRIADSQDSGTISLPHGVGAMVVSRSLGNSTYYPKINNPPELVVVELRKKTK